MTDLSDEAKALFERARPAHEPRAADYRRVLRGVLQGGVVAASALGTSASAAALGGGAASASGLAATGGLGLGAKLLFGGILVGSASFGLYEATRPPAPRAEIAATPAAAASQPEPRALARAPAVNAAPVPVEAEPKAAPVAEASAIELKRVAPSTIADAPSVPPPGAPTAVLGPAAAPAATASFPIDAPSPQTALSEEARALADVQRALREGQSARALALLDQQRGKFPRGELAPERAAARIVALCAAGRTAEAQREGAAFLAASPRSPLAARIRATCAGFPNGSPSGDP